MMAARCRGRARAPSRGQALRSPRACSRAPTPARPAHPADAGSCASIQSRSWWQRSPIIPPSLATLPKPDEDHPACGRPWSGRTVCTPGHGDPERGDVRWRVGDAIWLAGRQLPAIRRGGETGRRTGLKILRPSQAVWVRSPPSAPPVARVRARRPQCAPARRLKYCRLRRCGHQSPLWVMLAGNHGLMNILADARAEEQAGR